MGEVTYIEVLGRHGEVLIRHAIEDLPVRIGRAYDNDLIVDDPYVAPHHLRIERTSDGQLELVDLGTRNGLSRVGARSRLARAAVDSAARYRIGHTLFRIKPASFAVPPERLDHGHGWYAHPIAAFVLLAGAGGVLVIERWTETFERTEPLKLAIPGIWLVLALAIWAGGWALAGRLLTGQTRLPAHLATAALALICYLAVGVGVGYVEFAFSVSTRDVPMVVLLATVLAAALYQHLLLASRSPGRGPLVAAIVIGTLGIGSMWLLDYADRADSPVQMHYLKEIKRPEVRIARAVSPEAFFAEAARLEHQLLKAREAR